MPDIFDIWQARLNLTTRRSGRLTPEQERAYWREHATRYDERGSLARVAPVIVDRVAGLLPPRATVLEIGAGTGEFTIPVARKASSVTALDISPDMLSVLEQKTLAHGLTNITTIEGDWETCQVPPHEVVLAVNSLYRLRDPRAALRRIVRSARQRGILVRSIGTNPPAPPAALVAFGSERFDSRSDHGLLIAGLAELGVTADVEILSIPRIFQFQSIDEAAAVCLPWHHRTEPEWIAARDIVLDTMNVDGLSGSVTYGYSGQVAIISWKSA